MVERLQRQAARTPRDLLGHLVRQPGWKQGEAEIDLGSLRVPLLQHIEGKVHGRYKAEQPISLVFPQGVVHIGAAQQPGFHNGVFPMRFKLRKDMFRRAPPTVEMPGDQPKRTRMPVDEFHDSLPCRGLRPFRLECALLLELRFQQPGSLFARHGRDFYFPLAYPGPSQQPARGEQDGKPGRMAQQRVRHTPERCLVFGDIHQIFGIVQHQQDSVRPCVELGGQFQIVLDAGPLQRRAEQRSNLARRKAGQHILVDHPVEHALFQGGAGSLLARLGLPDAGQSHQ